MHVHNNDKNGVEIRPPWLSAPSSRQPVPNPQMSFEEMQPNQSDHVYWFQNQTGKIISFCGSTSEAANSRESTLGFGKWEAAVAGQLGIFGYDVKRYRDLIMDVGTGVQNVSPEDITALANAAPAKMMAPRLDDGRVNSLSFSAPNLDSTSLPVTEDFLRGSNTWVPGKFTSDVYTIPCQHPYDLNVPFEITEEVSTLKNVFEFTPYTPDKPITAKSKQIFNLHDLSQDQDKLEKSATTEGKDIVNSATDASNAALSTAVQDNENCDDGVTPERKPRRIKHRPKVVTECKVKKTPPKPVTPEPAAGSKEKPPVRRKYVRKKPLAKTPTTSSPVTDQEPSLKEDDSVEKSSRRRLNFDMEEETRDESSNVGGRTRSKPNVQLDGEEIELTIEIDLTADVNQEIKDRLSLSEKQAPSTPLPTKPRPRRRKADMKKDYTEAKDQQTAAGQHSAVRSKLGTGRIQSESTVQLGGEMIDDTQMSIAYDQSAAVTQQLKDYISSPNKQVPTMPLPTKPRANRGGRKKADSQNVNVPNPQMSFEEMQPNQSDHVYWFQNQTEKIISFCGSTSEAANSRESTRGFGKWEAAVAGQLGIFGYDVKRYRDLIMDVGTGVQNVSPEDITALANAAPAKMMAPRLDDGRVNSLSFSAPNFDSMSLPVTEDFLRGSNTWVPGKFTSDVSTIPCQHPYDLNVPFEITEEVSTLKNIFEFTPFTPDKPITAKSKQIFNLHDLSQDQDKPEKSATTEGKDIVNSATDASNAALSTAVQDNENCDDGVTPERKPRRRKHRPKVVTESKVQKTPPKPVTPEPAAGSKEKPPVRRKYVRKKPLAKTPTTSSPVTDQEPSLKEDDSVEKSSRINKEHYEGSGSVVDEPVMTLLDSQDSPFCDQGSMTAHDSEHNEEKEAVISNESTESINGTIYESKNKQLSCSNKEINETGTECSTGDSLKCHTSFMELLQMAESTGLSAIFNNGNGNNLRNETRKDKQAVENSDSKKNALGITSFMNSSYSLHVLPEDITALTNAAPAKMMAPRLDDGRVNSLSFSAPNFDSMSLPVTEDFLHGSNTWVPGKFTSDINKEGRGKGEKRKSNDSTTMGQAETASSNISGYHYNADGVRTNGPLSNVLQAYQCQMVSWTPLIYKKRRSAKGQASSSSNTFTEKDAVNHVRESLDLEAANSRESTRGFGKWEADVAGQLGIFGYDVKRYRDLIMDVATGVQNVLPEDITSLANAAPAKMMAPRLDDGRVNSLSFSAPNFDSMSLPVTEDFLRGSNTWVPGKFTSDVSTIPCQHPYDLNVPFEITEEVSALKNVFEFTPFTPDKPITAKCKQIFNLHDLGQDQDKPEKSANTEGKDIVNSATDASNAALSTAVQDNENCNNGVTPEL